MKRRVDNLERLERTFKRALGIDPEGFVIEVRIFEDENDPGLMARPPPVPDVGLTPLVIEVRQYAPMFGPERPPRRPPASAPSGPRAKTAAPHITPGDIDGLH